MDKKIYNSADLTVGDVGIAIAMTTDIDLSLYVPSDFEFTLIKPSGVTINRQAMALDGYTVTYYTVSGDIDEDGDWAVYLKNVKVGYEFVKGTRNFTVRPSAGDMANYNG
jgi:hypothetical protein